MKWLTALLVLIAVTWACGTGPSGGAAWNDRRLELEYARTPEERAAGLRGKTPLSGNRGMLFIYTDSAVRNYWMKGVAHDLALAYLDGDARIISIHHLKAGDETEVPSPRPARFVLEMRPGWFRDNGIAAGDLWPELADGRIP